MRATTTDEDKAFLVRHAMTVGYQACSLLVPPCYIACGLILKRRTNMNMLSTKRVLRTTWLGGAVGCAAGFGVESVRAANSRPDILRTRRLACEYDAMRVRAADHSTIGGILCSVMTPALLWKRAPAVDLFLGGAGIGSSIGLMTHYWRVLFLDPPPTPTIGNAQLRATL